MARYPSDISREQFKNIQEILEGSRRKTRPRSVDLYEVFCGVLYILKRGCQWRMLPKDYPKWRTCYSYFQQWNTKGKNGEDSVLESALKKCGWRGKTKQWSEQEHLIYHH